MSKPVNYEKMVELAERLSAPLKFSRIDFYEINTRRFTLARLLFSGGMGWKNFHRKNGIINWED